jgi:hypothetical protein
VHEVLVEQFLSSYDMPPQEVVLDLDATDDPTHGNQEGRFFHGYYGHYCYLPLYVFGGQHLLCAYLRPSNIDAAKHSRAITRLLVQRIRQRWPHVKIILRGDSGFCRWRLMRWCDRHGVFYVFGLARNPRLERELKPTMEVAQALCEATGQKQRLFTEFLYAAKTWDRPRRVIGKAEYSSQGANPRFVVTNLTDPAATLCDDRYCPRGDMENRIKEQQLYLFADRTSCSKLLANQFRLLLSGLANCYWTACVDWAAVRRPKANGNPRRSASGSSKWPLGSGSLPDESSFSCRLQAPSSLSSDAWSWLSATADNRPANAGFSVGERGPCAHRSSASPTNHPQTEKHPGKATVKYQG